MKKRPSVLADTDLHVSHRELVERVAKIDFAFLVFLQSKMSDGLIDEFFREVNRQWDEMMAEFPRQPSRQPRPKMKRNNQ